jgi:hypothetical protein
LNFAICLFNAEFFDRAKQQAALFENIYSQLDEDTRKSHPEIGEKRQSLRNAFAKLPKNL